MKKLKTLLMLCIMAYAVTSCKSPDDVVYLQDLTPSSPMPIQATQYITIQTGDKLLINVHSRDENISALFNIRGNNNTGMNYGAAGTQNSNTLDLSAYTVDADGNINFPVLGTIHVSGFTRQQVADYIRDILIDENLVKDPYVTCAFANSYFYVLGEISGRGRVLLQKDAISIIEAIATAGDLSLYGSRTDIQVMRVVNGQLRTYEVDLTDAHQIVTSPVYYIQPNDIIYVRPIEKRQFETTALGNSVRTPSFWLGIAGTVLSLGLTIYSIFK